MPSRLTGSRTRSTPARTALSSALALVLLSASTEILEGISPLLEEHDFDTINMDAEIGNVRRVAVEDRYGTSLTLSYDKALAVSLMTGCHLTEE